MLQTDTYAKGPGTTVASIIDGSAYGEDRLTAMAGVANIGIARNWTSHFFGQADWYAFGRLAWNPETSAEAIFKEWSTTTFPGNATVQQTAEMLLA